MRSLQERLRDGVWWSMREAADALDAAERYAEMLKGQYQRASAELNRILPTLDAAEAKLAAIDALHQPDEEGLCQECPQSDGYTISGYTTWPCDTHRIIHPEEGTDDVQA